VRVLKDGISALPLAKWSELAGPFSTLHDAEWWLDHPPLEVTPIGTVTVAPGVTGYTIFLLEETGLLVSER
jgi:hypothetical protein